MKTVRQWLAVALGILMEAALSADAAVTLGLSSASIQPGQTAALDLTVAGGAGMHGGFNATVLAPAPLRFAGAARGSLVAATNFDFYAADIDLGTARGVALSVASGTSAFAGAGGALATLRWTAAADCPPGTYAVRFLADTNNWPVELRHALADERGGLSVAHGISEGWIEVRRPPTPEASNGNGISDAWEIEHFGQITNISHTTDVDRDGLSDFYEFMSGTDPHDPLSCVRIESLGLGTNGVPVLRWYSIPGAVYRVEGTDDLRNGNRFSVDRAGIAATPPINIYTAAPPARTPTFLRVVREL